MARENYILLPIYLWSHYWKIYCFMSLASVTEVVVLEWSVDINEEILPPVPFPTFVNFESSTAIFAPTQALFSIRALLACSDFPEVSWLTRSRTWGVTSFPLTPIESHSPRAWSITASIDLWSIWRKKEEREKRKLVHGEKYFGVYQFTLK